MAIKNYFERFRYMDYLIRIKSTGTPKQFAKKIGICERMLYEYLNTMKSEGAHIEYSELEQTYYYPFDGKFIIGYQLKELVDDEKMSISGGFIDCYQIFLYCNNIAVSFSKIALLNV